MKVVFETTLILERLVKRNRCLIFGSATHAEVRMIFLRHEFF